MYRKFTEKDFKYANKIIELAREVGLDIGAFGYSPTEGYYVVDSMDNLLFRDDSMGALYVQMVLSVHGACV